MKKKQLQQAVDQSGYTFIEMIVVLTVIATIALLPVISGYPAVKSMEVTGFIRQFGKDIMYAKQFAITHDTVVVIYLYPEQHKYRLVKAGSFEQIMERHYPQGIHISLNTLGGTIRFNAQGNATKSGTMHIKNQQGDLLYSLVITIGRGTLNVKAW